MLHQHIDDMLQKLKQKKLPNTSANTSFPINSYTLTGFDIFNYLTMTFYNMRKVIWNTHYLYIIINLTLNYYIVSSYKVLKIFIFFINPFRLKNDFFLLLNFFITLYLYNKYNNTDDIIQ